MTPNDDDQLPPLQTELRRLQTENDRLRGLNQQLLDYAFPLDDFTDEDAKRLMTETDGEPILSIIEAWEAKA